MIITQTPFRMSFFGGGTDTESFFKKKFYGEGNLPFVELVALKLHLIKVPT